MSESIALETNELRSSLGPRAMFTDLGFLRDLAKKLKRTKELSRQPIVQCFIEDIMASDDSIRLLNTKAHINERRDNQIFSLFNASYFPSLSLDFLTYEPLHVVGDSFADKFESRTNPVTIAHMSEGFEARVVVALFPENHIDNVQEESDAIFYFIDKFVERHDRITRKMLDNIVSADAFPLVRDATPFEVEKASSHWVWLHEYHHRQGDMPLPKYVHLKASKKALAGLEELRVDITGLLACRGDCGLSARDADLTYQFILSERLLRYAVEGIPTPNYDAVASQLLFNYLREHGGIFLKDHMLHLAPRLPEVLAQFLGKIESIERLIHQQEPEQVADRLLEFVNQYTRYDPATDEYQHIDFFVDVKRRLNV